MSSRVAIYHSTHSVSDCRLQWALLDSSCAGSMFYKLIILLSGSSSVLLCSLHATLHLRYTHVDNCARSSTFLIWSCRAFSLPTAVCGDTQVPMRTKTFFFCCFCTHQPSFVQIIFLFKVTLLRMQDNVDGTNAHPLPVSLLLMSKDFYNYLHDKSQSALYPLQDLIKCPSFAAVRTQ